MGLLAGFGDLGLTALKASVEAKLVELSTVLATVEGLPDLLDTVEDLQNQITALQNQSAAQDAG